MTSFLPTLSDRRRRLVASATMSPAAGSPAAAGRADQRGPLGPRRRGLTSTSFSWPAQVRPALKGAPGPAWPAQASVKALTQKYQHLDTVKPIFADREKVPAELFLGRNFTAMSSRRQNRCPP